MRPDELPINKLLEENETQYFAEVHMHLNYNLHSICIQ